MKVDKSHNLGTGLARLCYWLRRPCFLLFSGCLFTAIGYAPNLHAQEGAYEQAWTLATQNEFEKAEQILGKLTLEYPSYLPAQLLRANNFAWNKNYQEAIEILEQLILEEPTLLSPKIDLAYITSWSGQWQDAERQFRQLNNAYPGHREIRKGLAISLLNQARWSEAIPIFQALSDESPQEIEYLYSLATAYAQSGNKQKAHDTLDELLLLDPDNNGAKNLKASLVRIPGVLEIDLWGSFSQVGQENSFGIRAFQLFYQAFDGLALFGRYDNSLSLDNIDFLSLGTRAEAVWLGTLYDWSSFTATKLEIGQRFFSGKEYQHLFKIEQIFYLKNPLSLRLGGFAGLSRNLPFEWYTYVGLNIPLTKGFQFEPTYFYAKDANSTRPHRRLILAGSLHLPQGLELTAGGFYGRSNLQLENLNENIVGGYLIALAPVHRQLWGQLSVNRENGVFNTTTAVALGLKWRM